MVNGGTLYTPYIVKNFLESETDTIVKSIEPNAVGSVISSETSEIVRYALESVVAKGSGHNAYIENYRIGGKTGTAQTVENGVYSDSKYILSFIGFMPADDPEIVVYVAVQNAKNVVQYGGTVAAPIARNIFLSAIDILDIANAIDKLLSSGFTCINDLRILIGLDPIDEEWANQFFMTKNYAPIEELLNALKGGDET